jgi:hypothetical protein
MDNHDFPFTHAVAAASVVSPMWLHSVNDVATTVLTLLGIGWLLLQAYVFIRDNIIKKPK